MASSDSCSSVIAAAFSISTAPSSGRRGGCASHQTRVDAANYTPWLESRRSAPSMRDSAPAVITSSLTLDTILTPRVPPGTTNSRSRQPASDRRVRGQRLPSWSCCAPSHTDWWCGAKASPWRRRHCQITRQPGASTRSPRYPVVDDDQVPCLVFDSVAGSSPFDGQLPRANSLAQAAAMSIYSVQ